MTQTKFRKEQILNIDQTQVNNLDTLINVDSVQETTTDHGVDIESLNIEGNIIKSLLANQDINILPDGTGSIRLGDGNVTSNLGMLIVDGAVSSLDGPHTAFFVSGDNNYPVFQQMNWSHDNIVLNFDTYYDGTSYKSSDAGSNFQIQKQADTLKFKYDSGVTAGDDVTMNTGFQVNTAGNITKLNNVEFNVYRSFNANNHIGGSVYALIPYSSERIDNQDRYHTTGYFFTAPVTGRYLFTFSASMLGFDNTNTNLIMRLITSNKNYRVHQENPWLNRASTGEFLRSGSVYVDLDAADTASIEVYCNGNKVVELIGDTDGYKTWFTGCLIQ